MNAKELRLGNYINHKFDELEFNEVVGVDWEFIYLSNITCDYVSFDDCEPILLTEEWLLKMGFELLHEYEHDFTEKIFGINITDCNNEEKLRISLPFQTIEIGDEDSSYYVANINIKHVHQLQNLYFALTGEELTIK